MNKTYPRAAAQQSEMSDIVPKLEGMEVEFDEKVTLVPVELEEMRDLTPKGERRPARARGPVLH